MDQTSMLNYGDMDSRTSSVAQRTRAKIHESMLAVHKLNQKKKKKPNSVTAAVRKGKVWNRSDSSRKNEQLNAINAEDVVILDDDDEEVDRKIKARPKVMNTRKRNNVDKEVKEKLNPKKRKRTVRRSLHNHDSEEESDDGVQLLREMPALINDTSKRNPSVPDDDEGMDRDAQTVSKKSFVNASKRGKSYENRKSYSSSDSSAADFSSSEEDEDRNIQIMSKKSFVIPSEGGGGYETSKRSSIPAFSRPTEAEDLALQTSSKKSFVGPSNGGRSCDDRKSSSGSSGSDFSSSEEEDDSDDTFTGGESGSSDSQSDDSSYCTGVSQVESDDCNDTEGNAKLAKANAKKNSVDVTASEECERDVGDGFKKIRADGLDIWVDLNRTDKGKQQGRSVRLRPRSVNESEKKNSKFGTYSCPLRVDENESCDSSDEEGSHRSKERRKELRKPSKKRSLKSKSVGIKRVINSIVDSILGEGEALDEILASNKEEASAENALPLRFRFEDEDPPAPPEKQEWEKEVDGLFAELEMCLEVPDTDANTASMAEDHHVNDQMKNPVEECPFGGDHQLVLEEPTGILCRRCQIVCLEMKYIFPELKMPTPGKRDSVNSEPGGCSMFDEFQLGDSARDNYSALKPTKGDVLDLIPAKIRKDMYDHQLEGFKFLWKNVIGETRIEKLQSHLSNEGSGCIISHAPGTGKTCLSIAFIMSMMRFYPTCRPVIVAPHSMLLTWEHEFEKWDFGLPFYNLNSEELLGEETEIALPLHRFSRRPNEKDKRHFNRVAKLYSWAKQRSVLGVSYTLFEKLANGSIGEKGKKILLELPGFLVLDEGHTPRNKRSHMWEALTEVKTRRRIILSGTPFQNNVDELCNTLSLVNPKLSVYKKSFKSITELKVMIDPLVNVYKGSILQESLPGLKDMLVKLRPADQQKRALQLISDVRSFLEKVHLVALISVHPSLATKKMGSLFQESGLGLLDPSPNAGVKTKFVVALVALCAKLHEKVLIFSEYIKPLKFIKQQLEDKFSWTEGREVLYMDGKQDAKIRQSSINSLNAPESEVKVFLASTKACSEGINLVGASRVVLLDVVWNPSVERQAISRAYRLGQKKIVYVYHLITSGTLEEDKYEQQMKKHHLSERLFSCQDRENKKFSSAVAEDKVLEAMIDAKNLKDMFEDIVHDPKESNLFEDYNFLEPKD
ncbi:OLC1v1025740C1 [Oldenlandia corymbosa var. corymbosa]|uniref:OLC1v1025740C1 n=1 Tax=Oldenlandia corymbosa var. corymbosa TaxID=529605 RepID=A0AAV1C5G3_OLDCO|nr:OLC1v1025740C1 [Oldenlandia corymbosa var. corymbosa]